MEALLHFSTVTWNILADAYIKPGRYDHVPPEALAPGPRRILLIDGLLSFSADLYCLQEVEPDAFAAIGQALGSGYVGLYEQKHARPEGCAIFARSEAFTLVEQEAIHFRHIEPGYDHVALVAYLLHRSGHKLALASTHLRWQADSVPVEHNLGRLQLLEILDRRAARRDQWPAWLVCGDFNALSDGVVLKAAMSQGLELSCRALRPWDTTNIGGRMRKLDYLLYEPGQLVPSPRPLPRLQRGTPMPSSVHASDHLPVCIDYRWVGGA